MGRHLSPRYGHVVLVSGYPILTIVNEHNIDVQLAFSWAPKPARKCGSKHWFPCGADGRSFVRRSVYGHVITKFSGLRYDLYAVQLDLYTVGDKGRKPCDHFKS